MVNSDPAWLELTRNSIELDTGIPRPLSKGENRWKNHSQRLALTTGRKSAAVLLKFYVIKKTKTACSISSNQTVNIVPCFYETGLSR